MRKVYVYDHETKEMVEKGQTQYERLHLIAPDIADFVSTVDGKVVHGRAGLRAHNKLHGVTNPADFKEHWDKFQQKREALSTGRLEDPKRKEAIVRAFHKLQGRTW